VNPVHLFLGTNADNIRDAMAKGRWKKPPGVRMYGERNHNAKLSALQVYEVRAARLGGESLKSLAARYSVAESCISRIANGRRRQSE
jgi:hypothetical protein